MANKLLSLVLKIVRRIHESQVIWLPLGVAVSHQPFHYDINQLLYITEEGNKANLTKSYLPVVFGYFYQILFHL